MYMLTKKDVELLEVVIQKAVKAGFDDFYDNIFLPHDDRNEEHMERSEKQHHKIASEIRVIKKEVYSIKADTEEIKEHVKDHDKRIRKIETVTSN
jgi:septal ring factor EnvC (AmiA/AmiB activator)